MKMRGIKRGQIIELLDQIDDIPDGAEITVEVVTSSTKSNDVKQSLTEQERLIRLNQLFGAWKDQTDLNETFAEVDRQRHAY